MRRVRENPQARHETCIDCGLRWNVSRNAAAPFFGYVCPRCRKLRWQHWEMQKKEKQEVQ